MTVKAGDRVQYTPAFVAECVKDHGDDVGDMAEMRGVVHMDVNVEPLFGKPAVYVRWDSGSRWRVCASDLEVVPE